MHTFRKDRKTTTVLRERVAALSKKELRERASRYRRRAMLLWAALGSALAVLFTLLFGGLPLWLGTESPGGTALAIAGGVALGVTLLPFFGLFATLRRTDEDLVLRALRHERSVPTPTETAPTDGASEAETPFSPTRSILVLTSGRTSACFLIDDRSRAFRYREGEALSDVYAFSELLGYEVFENGESRVTGAVGAPPTAGSFFETVEGSREHEECHRLRLVIRIDDPDCPSIGISYVDDADWDRSGWLYKNMKENIRSVTAVLDGMMNVAP